MTSNGNEPARIVWAANPDDAFNHDSLAELLEYHGGELDPGRTVYFGLAMVPDTNFVLAHHVVDQIRDAAYDIGGEHAEDFLADLPKEAEQELSDFLAAWQAKHCKPTFYTVEGVKPYTLTESDYQESTP